MVVRKAKNSDVTWIVGLINDNAERGDMLQRTEDEVYELVRDFFVAEDEGRLAGCAALHVIDDALAEIRSLAVSRDVQGRGLGKALVNACLDEAFDLGVYRVFALTLKPAFFEKLGFERVPRSTFPQKIWRDCFKCKLFEACPEVAVQKLMRCEASVSPIT